MKRNGLHARCAALSATLALCGSAATPAHALDGGPLRITPDNGWKAFEVISQGDDPSGDGFSYAMPTTFDGAGARLDGSTLRVQVNHETSDASISEVQLDLGNLQVAIDSMINSGSTGGTSFVLAARQAYDRWSDNGGASWTNTASTSNTSFSRFCSGQAYAPDTFGAGQGFVDHVYITGEESSGGRLMALDSVGRDLYQLSGVTGSAPGGSGGMSFDSWENAALIDTGETDHVALLLSPDGGSSSLKLYVGEKGKDANGNPAASFLARNGLAYGSWYYLAGSLPGSVGGQNGGSFGTSSSGALAATKMEDVDTSPSQPTRVVLGNQNSGVFTLDFDLVFGPSFDAAQSSFAVTKIDANSGGLNNADNVDWTRATTLGGNSYPEGLIFVNEDNSTGEIWRMEPDGTNQVRVGSTTVGAESSGIFDLSELVGYAPGSVLITNNQGSPASMTLLINPDATSLSGGCGDALCDASENPLSCPQDCPDVCGDTYCSGAENTTTCPEDCGALCGDGACNGSESSATCPEDCGSICGDGTCNGSESSTNCPADCGSQCGDGTCNGGESTSTCPADCGSQCGDGVCNGAEDANNCPADCGAPPAGGSYSVNDISGSWWSWGYFSVEIPAGMSTLHVTLSGGSGNASLYVRQGQNPTPSSYDCRSTQSGNDEDCTLSNPLPGTWYIGVRGSWFSFSGANLLAAWE